jgi:hypothetical protein
LHQAACAIWIVYLLLREFGVGGRPFVLIGLIGLIATLSLTTTLAFLTSILLTDIFAGLAVIALYLLVFGHCVVFWERVEFYWWLPSPWQAT